MRVTSVEPRKQYQSMRLKAAKHGAIITAGMYSVSNALSWAANPQQLKSAVKEYGGKANFIKGYTASIAMLALLGGAVNVCVNEIIKKIHFKNNPPKAAN